MDRKKFAIISFSIGIIFIVLILIFLKSISTTEKHKPTEEINNDDLLTESLELYSNKGKLEWKANNVKLVKWYKVCCFYKCESSMCEICSNDNKIRCVLIKKKKDVIICKIPKKNYWKEEKGIIRCSISYF